MKNEPKSYSVKMYAEMKLEDGRIIATEDEQFVVGSKVFAIGDDSEATPLEAGSYTMENGYKLSIDDKSKILDLGEEKESEEELSAEDTREPIEEQLAEESEAEETDWAKTFEEMKDRVEALEKAVYGENVNVEASAEEKTEMSNEVIGELMTQIEELKSKIVELSGEPASEGIEYNPEGRSFNSTVDLRKLSTKERVAYYINNK